MAKKDKTAGEILDEKINDSSLDFASNNEETVTIKKSDLDSILKRLDSMSADQKLLFQAADKSRLARIMNDGNTQLVHTAKISRWDGIEGKFVISSKLISNTSEIVGGKVIEDQNCLVVFNDGETVTVPYLEFARKTLIKDVGEMIGSSIKMNPATNKEEKFVELQLENGNKITININSIN